MMVTKLSIEEVKSIEVSILDYIDSICKNNQLNYYLAYGTLLGAIRHKGFIPWDDDIDIYMPRDDYNKFIKIFQGIDQERYKLLRRGDGSDYYYEYAKVVDSRTCITPDNDILAIRDDGVWVDIFPLDKLPKLRVLIKPVILLFVVFRILSVYKTFPVGKFSRALYPFWWIAKLIGPGFFLSITDKLSQVGTSKKYVGYMCGIVKYYFPKAWCDEVVEVDFERKKYPAFKEYDGYLRYQYGDYMKLPPEDKRVSHPMCAYWREK